uniref:Uncharacterized protein n=1 Tax=Anguilla anguilla TaxID=7936 RepID=A0A0E9TS61_ANGAN
MKSLCTAYKGVIKALTKDTG